MICRIWRGWTSKENATAYEDVVRNEVIPNIESLKIEGFLEIDLAKRERGDEVEFITIMWFANIESVKKFIGEDYETSHVPAAAQAVLSRFDVKAAHYELLDRRSQF